MSASDSPSSRSQIPFTKMHGCGNDFVVLDCRNGHIGDMEDLAKRLCHRRFGVGADQMLTIRSSATADFKMEIYNADGGQVEMCGNGIRCLAKYVHDHGLTDKRALEVETLAGIVRPRLVGGDVEVDMGEPIFEGRKIPVDADGRVLGRPLEVGGTTYEISCVSMGNPHCVVFLNGIDRLDLETIGPKFERHSFFPKRVNTEFVEVLGRGKIRMRVWERGAGETWACGTGACAAAVMAAASGLTDRLLTVQLRGGELKIEWRSDNRVYMTGGAEEVFQGVFKL